MNTLHPTRTSARGRRRRLIAWSAAAGLLLLPLIAMQVTDEVAWSVSDVGLFGAMLLGAGVTFELAARSTSSPAYRAAVGVALGAAFLLTWINGAVGVIGSEHDDANLMVGGVLAVGLVGALLARFQAAGLARAMLATALALVGVAGVAVVGGLGSPTEVVALTGGFAALFGGSAWLFRQAARDGSERSAPASGPG